MYTACVAAGHTMDTCT